VCARIGSSEPAHRARQAPEGSLSDLAGTEANGQWKLRIVDRANQDTGTVGCVRLKIKAAN
jgi:subtilisin-like proprotein convertase family protein